MPVAYYQIQLALQPTGGGQAQLAVPEALHELSYQFVIVKDGGEEGIVRVEAPKATLDALAKTESLKKVTEHQVAELRAGYPPPRLRERYRLVATPPADAEVLLGSASVEQVALDDQGQQVLETIQTVRAGFHLIDVPVVP
jgi:hypothetical protein